ncbi:cytochrome b5-like heme/steroid binding domain-containing protein [Aspergillus lucknowensis]|uniref:Cytochrome b5-like heme/steroid binding domain-containing protein n=1 Tax=Aspergillus lucknowensis TaxID=176173 RepID=A0ABR4LRF9_9EURO
MGWLTLRRRPEASDAGQPPPPPPPPEKDTITASAEHAEDISNSRSSSSPRTESQSRSQEQPFLGREYPAVDLSTPDSDLPYIDPKILSLVEEHWSSSTSSDSDSASSSPQSQSQSQAKPSAWIVIDDIVYDCTEFQHEHPGGTVVIRSFVGQDCTWQFWRFHTKQLLKEYGRGLRIGRTSGMKNRFKEPPRYVGLSSLGDDW